MNFVDFGLFKPQNFKNFFIFEKSIKLLKKVEYKKNFQMCLRISKKTSTLLYFGWQLN